MEGEALAGMDGAIYTRSQLSDDGSQLFYMDQIIEGCGQQTTMVAASCLESILSNVHINFPWVRRVIIQSDNARNYSNERLPILIAATNQRNEPAEEEESGIPLD